MKHSEIDKYKYNLRGYIYLRKKIREEHGNELIHHKLLYYSELSLINFLELTNLPEFKPSKKIFFGKGYIKKDEVGFKKVKENRDKFLYKVLVYKLRFKKILKNKVYFGYTEHDKKRLQEHIISSIETPPDTKIKKAFCECLKDEKYDLDELYFCLDDVRNSSKYYRFINRLIGELIGNYFDFEILELHKEIDTAKEREKWYTLNYINKDGSIGTIENGLNEVAGGSGGDYIDLPLIDFAAMIMLGLNVKQITEIIIRIYKISVSDTTVRSRIIEIWGGIKRARKLLLKPVIEALIKDNANFEVRDIHNVLLSRCSIVRYLKEWYSGRTFSDLKNLMKYGILDWTNLSEFDEFERLLRSYPLNNWYQWALENESAEKIAKLTKTSLKTIYRTYKGISEKLVGVSDLSLREIRKIIQKKKAKELLGKCWEPKIIMENVFKMNPIGFDDVRNFYERLFNFKLTYNQILNKY